MTAERIGLCPEWMFGSSERFQALMRKQENGDADNAVKLVSVARQTAKWRYLTYAMVDLFCKNVPRAEHRNIVAEKIEELTNIPKGQGKRYLNSLGLYTNKNPKFDQSQKAPTQAVMEDQYSQGSNFIESMNWNSFENLAIRTGEPLNRFLLEPYQLIANTTYCLLTFTAARHGDLLQSEHLELVKARYPKIPYKGFTNPTSEWNPAKTCASTTLYGVYMVYRARNESRNQDASRDFPTIELVRETIQTCLKNFRWVFPRVEPSQIVEVCDSGIFDDDVIEILLETARCVGQALCQNEPFNESWQR